MARKKADYPEWVMQYKTKGTYINKVGDRYYLYAAHSVREKETGKIRRVSDGYIGRITEEDGLIRSKSRLKTDPVSMEIGLSYPILLITGNIRTGIKRRFPKHGDYVFSRGSLLYIYDTYSDELYSQSYLSVFFTGAESPSQVTDVHCTEIERCGRMIADVMNKKFSEDIGQVLKLFQHIRLIRIDDIYYLSGITSEIASLSEKYDIKWEDPLWQR